MHAHIVFTLNAGGLTPGTEYGCTFDWQGAAGGTEGGTNSQKAGPDGKVSFQLDPTVLIAISHDPGPGTLTLAVTNADGSDLGAGYTVTHPVA